MNRCVGPDGQGDTLPTLKSGYTIYILNLDTGSRKY